MGKDTSTDDGDSRVHRVTVEFIARQMEVHDFASAEDARRGVETAKQNSEAWHVWYAVQEPPEGRQRIVMSLYRSQVTREWQSLFLPRVTNG